MRRYGPKPTARRASASPRRNSKEPAGRPLPLWAHASRRRPCRHLHPTHRRRRRPRRARRRRHHLVCHHPRHRRSGRRRLPRRQCRPAFLPECQTVSSCCALLPRAPRSRPPARAPSGGGSVVARAATERRGRGGGEGIGLTRGSATRKRLPRSSCRRSAASSLLGSFIRSDARNLVRRGRTEAEDLAPK